ncbi:response regulator [Pseudomonas yamanorum]|uniref:response regulator n=1 Tax=Pseudomonas yamanorum TaxID=515393 RepID=UPI0015A176F5|nr:response regulator [Pseudomonas yamanorum]
MLKHLINECEGISADDLGLSDRQQLMDAPAEQPPQPPKASGALSVLIVDDFIANRVVLRQQLSYLGHDVHEAQSGTHALELWNSQPFDVVISDCNMPGMSGYELARSIRRQEQQRGEPNCLLLGFTANTAPEEKQRCLDSGMNDCLFKPVSLQQLIDRLQPLQAECFAQDQGADPSITCIEKQLGAFTFDNPAVIQELKDELLSNSRVDIDLLATLIREDDREGLAEFAHRVKGPARLIRYEQLIVCCENLEAAAQASPGRLEELADALERCLVHLVDCLGGDPGITDPLHK